MNREYSRPDDPAGERFKITDICVGMPETGKLMMKIVNSLYSFYACGRMGFSGAGFIEISLILVFQFTPCILTFAGANRRTEFAIVADLPHAKSKNSL
jgi:hypothetical protein